MLILALVAVFAVTMVLGVPVAFCLGLGGLAFIWLSGVVPIAVLPTLMFSGMDSFPLLAIPFFVIAGDAMQRCGILPNLIAFANSLVGHFRGGLAYVVIVTSMMFAGVTGVALAECAAIGSMLAPSMVRQGYPGGFTSAVIAGSAVMGPIIPPSVAMLVFAYVYGGGISVGKLFLMGIVPGVLIGLTMMALVAVQARRRGFPVSGERFSIRRVLRALRGATLGLVVPAIIIGGILGGVFTPTEAGAVAAAYGVLVGVFVLRTLKLVDLRKSLLVGAKTSAVIYLLLGTSNVVSWILVRNQVPHAGRHRRAVPAGPGARGGAHHDHADSDTGAGRRGVQDRSAPARPRRRDGRADSADQPAGGAQPLHRRVHREGADEGRQPRHLAVHGGGDRHHRRDGALARGAVVDSEAVRVLDRSDSRSSKGET
jgi:tripartite ATP-independent transporter DctM subunit